MRKISTTFLVAVLSLVALAGCQAPARPATSSTTEPSKTAPSTGSSTTTAAKDESAVSEPSKATLTEIPTLLQHEGYAYFGLSNLKPLEYEFRNGSSPAVTGSMLVTVESIEPEQATFKVERSGGLSSLGNATVRVDSAGVWTMKEDIGAPKKPNLELKAEVKPGMTWDLSNEVEVNDVTIRITATAQVVKTAEVKTKAGTFQAIVVTNNAKLASASVNGTMDSTTWYVKDIGIVKMSVVTKLGAQESKMEMELIKKPE